MTFPCLSWRQRAQKLDPDLSNRRETHRWSSVATGSILPGFWGSRAKGVCSRPSRMGSFLEIFAVTSKGARALDHSSLESAKLLRSVAGGSPCGRGLTVLASCYIYLYVVNWIWFGKRVPKRLENVIGSCALKKTNFKDITWLFGSKVQSFLMFFSTPNSHAWPPLLVASIWRMDMWPSSLHPSVPASSHKCVMW